MTPQSPWIVIPTYNERSNIAKMMPALLALSIPNLSILVVDDNSPDHTGAAVQEFKATHPQVHLLPRAQKEGLGRAYLAGFTYALEHGADAIVQMDADFSHDPNDVPKLLAELAEADVVIGSRYLNGISVINWPLHRLLLSYGGNIYTRKVTGMPFKDSTAGFKAWRAETLRTLDFDSVKALGYGFQIVMTYRAWKQGAKVKEVPIIFTERRDGQSKMSNDIVKEGLWLVWRLRLFG